MPLRSEEKEAAVDVVLGTLSVLVSLMWIVEAGILSTLEATCQRERYTLVCVYVFYITNIAQPGNARGIR